MPVTILSSDLAYAQVHGDGLALRFEGDRDPPGYVVIRRSGDGHALELIGPFEFEDEALEHARIHFGDLTWSHH